jgi:hypothetical protein
LISVTALPVRAKQRVCCLFKAPSFQGADNPGQGRGNPKTRQQWPTAPIADSSQDSLRQSRVSVAMSIFVEPRHQDCESLLLLPAVSAGFLTNFRINFSSFVNIFEKTGEGEVRREESARSD